MFKNIVWYLMVLLRAKTSFGSEYEYGTCYDLIYKNNRNVSCIKKN